MKRAALSLALLAVAFWAAAPQITGASATGGASRAAVVSVEKSFDERLERLLGDPLLLLSSTQGVYLEGYGAVFTAGVNLALGPGITPFRRTRTKGDLETLRARKLGRLPDLRQTMRDMLVGAAASLDTVPPTEQVVLSVSLFHFSWEETAGLPSQILMQGQRQALLDVKTGKLKGEAADSAIRLQEF